MCSQGSYLGLGRSPPPTCRMCSLYIECVLSIYVFSRQLPGPRPGLPPTCSNVFSIYRMCPLYICVLKAATWASARSPPPTCRMCSLYIECVLSIYVFSRQLPGPRPGLPPTCRMCSLYIECVLSIYVFSRQLPWPRPGPPPPPLCLFNNKNNSENKHVS